MDVTDLSPITCEARLMGLSKARRKDGDWVEVKFHIHPNDHPHALFILPLGTDCTLSIKGIPESAEEAEQTQTAPERVKGGPRSKRAGIACGLSAFQDFIQDWRPETYYAPGHLTWKEMAIANPDWSNAELAAAQVRWWCNVGSRAELDHNIVAGETWDQIERDYHAAMEGRTPEALAEQARSGP